MGHHAMSLSTQISKLYMIRQAPRSLPSQSFSLMPRVNSILGEKGWLRTPRLPLLRCFDPLLLHEPVILISIFPCSDIILPDVGMPSNSDTVTDRAYQKTPVVIPAYTCHPPCNCLHRCLDPCLPVLYVTSPPCHHTISACPTAVEAYPLPLHLHNILLNTSNLLNTITTKNKMSFPKPTSDITTTKSTSTPSPSPSPSKGQTRRETWNFFSFDPLDSDSESDSDTSLKGSGKAREARTLGKLQSMLSGPALLGQIEKDHKDAKKRVGGKNT
jgi:hypothetical protein